MNGNNNPEASSSAAPNSEAVLGEVLVNRSALRTVAETQAPAEVRI